MSSRYQDLRQAVAALAAGPEEQVRFLDELFSPLTGGGSSAAYGNDELALELDDCFFAANAMIERGELTPAEKTAIMPVDELLRHWSGEGNSSFWRREALFDDPRWGEVRAHAAAALAQLPDDERQTAFET